eukprot:TRINITY_DN7515_c0_g1_i2.p1 TRINITY_DN7515_c0_g1~~TRINITY_DN7515_c0_g1_i2.p1  ORF type:complete len:535 (+),score=104.05 TRINITY_DN7515_c0_g1_i2:734-2338(+)
MRLRLARFLCAAIIYCYLPNTFGQFWPQPAFDASSSNLANIVGPPFAATPATILWPETISCFAMQAISAIDVSYISCAVDAEQTLFFAYNLNNQSFALLSASCGNGSTNMALDAANNFYYTCGNALFATTNPSSVTSSKAVLRLPDTIEDFMLTSGQYTILVTNTAVYMYTVSPQSAQMQLQLSGLRNPSVVFSKQPQTLFVQQETLLQAFQPPSVIPLWSVDLAGTFSDVAFFAMMSDHVGNLYVVLQATTASPTAYSRLCQISSTGMVSWSAALNSSAHLTNLARDSADNIFVGSGSVLYAFGSDGTTLWTCELSAAIITAPIVDVAGMVFVGAGMHLFGVANGSIAWSVATNPHAVASMEQQLILAVPGLIAYAHGNMAEFFSLMPQTFATASPAVVANGLVTIESEPLYQAALFGSLQCMFSDVSGLHVFGTSQLVAEPAASGSTLQCVANLGRLLAPTVLLTVQFEYHDEVFAVSRVLEIELGAGVGNQAWVAALVFVLLCFGVGLVQVILYLRKRMQQINEENEGFPL